MRNKRKSDKTETESGDNDDSHTMRARAESRVNELEITSWCGRYVKCKRTLNRRDGSGVESDESSRDRTEAKGGGKEICSKVRIKAWVEGKRDARREVRRPTSNRANVAEDLEREDGEMRANREGGNILQ